MCQFAIRIAKQYHPLLVYATHIGHATTMNLDFFCYLPPPPEGKLSPSEVFRRDWEVVRQSLANRIYCVFFSCKSPHWEGVRGPDPTEVVR